VTGRAYLSSFRANQASVLPVIIVLVFISAHKSSMALAKIQQVEVRGHRKMVIHLH
jgi:hypothetical protein